MFRSGRHSCLTRSTIRFITSCNRRTSSFAIAHAPRASNLRIQSSSRSSSLELTVHKPWSRSLQRFASTAKPVDEVDKKAEEKVANKVIQPHPEEVTVDSTVHQVFHEKGRPDEEEDVEMLAGVWSDIVSKPAPMLAYMAVMSLTMGLNVESHQGGFCLSGSSPRSLHHRHGRRTSISWNVTYDSLSSMGHKSCRNDRKWLFGIREHSRATSTHC